MSSLYDKLDVAKRLIAKAAPYPNGTAEQNPLFDVLSDLVTTTEESTRKNHVLVSSEKDLPLPDANGVIQLENKTYSPNGLVVCKHPVQLNGGTSIIGFDMGRDVFFYTGTGAFIRGGGAQTILSRFAVMAPYGSALDIEGPLDKQLMMEFVGFIGCASVGTVTSYEVASMKSCVVMPAEGMPANDGIKFAGTSNKVFIFGTPFLDLEESAVAVDFTSTFNTRIIDISTNYFKALNTTMFTGVRTDPAATIQVDARFIGNAYDGDIVATSGFDHKTPIWDFKNNSGLPDSKLNGRYYWDGNTVQTTFTTVNTPTKVLGATTVEPLSVERMEHVANNRIAHTGVRAVSARVLATVTVAGADNNTQYTVYLAKNGTIIPSSGIKLRVAQSTDNRSVTTFTVNRIEPGDYFEIWAENNDGIGGLTVIDGSVLVYS